MNTATVLSLVKAGIGISSTVRDTYLMAIIDGIIKELTDEKGIILETENANHLMFVVDYATWRYEARDNEKGMPRHLQFRLHNLVMHNTGGEDIV